MLIFFTVILGILLYLLLDYFFDIGCDQAQIKNIASIPGYPVVGNLLRLGQSQALTYRTWALQYGPVFQLRLGTKRVVVANSYDAVKELWVDNMTANCSRPYSYTFHKIVSASQGFTIGTTPWSDSYKRKRRVAGSALNKPSVKSYMSFIDKESAYCIRSMATRLECDIDVSPFFRAYALNTGLSINYGTRLDRLDRDILQEIIGVEKKIGQFRASLDSYQDYLPILRVIPTSTSHEAVDCRQRRDFYMNLLLENLKLEIEQGQAASCITGNILQDPQANVTVDDLKSICLTMVSAGLDTVPSALIYFMGHMSQPYGQEIQERAFAAIQERYQGDAWNACLHDQSIPYIRALMDETLRCSAMPISLPRETIKDIYYQDATIPAGTRLLMNAFAANFDPNHYSHPYKFMPERYLDASNTGPKHFAFGAGLRMCAGVSLAESELYTAIVRLVVSFHICPPSNDKDLMPGDPFYLYRRQRSLVVDPPPFKVRLVPRECDELASSLGLYV